MIGGGVFFLFVLAVFTLIYLTLHAGGDNASMELRGQNRRGRNSRRLLIPMR